MQQNVHSSFLHGQLTTSDSIAQLKQALTSAEESQFDIVYYKKDGQCFTFQSITAYFPNRDWFSVVNSDMWTCIIKTGTNKSNDNFIPIYCYLTVIVLNLIEQFQLIWEGTTVPLLYWNVTLANKDLNDMYGYLSSSATS